MVFVLREVFDVPYDEIAEAVEKSPAAVRQIAHRARGHVEARRPRTAVTAAEQEAVLRKFITATTTGDIQSLLEVLAPDVVLLTDGGGFKRAALRPIHGSEKVLRFFAGGASRDGGVERAEIVELNGAPGLQLWMGGEVDTVVSVLMEHGVVTALYAVRNPEKLRTIEQQVALER